MYPENPEGTQVIVGSMNMGYISDTDTDSSLILVGWCEEGHPATKNLLQLSQG